MGEGAALTFLGTADSKGVPRWWCDCPVCREARQGGRNRRTRSAALLEADGQTALLDCGPDLHGQLARLGRPLIPGVVLISHAHNDHLLGLGDLLDYVSYAGGQLPVYAPASVLPQIEERFRYAFRSSAPVQPLPDEGLSVCGHWVRAFEVPHGANGTSHAFHFERPGHRWVYLTDSIDVPQEVVERWLIDLDLLVLGSSFFDESGVVHSTRSVYDVREALQLPWVQAAGQVWLTHLSHDVDVTRALPDPRYRYAREGQTLALQQ